MRSDMHDGKEQKLSIGINALRILEKRYLLKDKKGKVVETPDQMFRRVAKEVARVDKRKGIEQEFYDLMSNLDFLPNSPTLMNAGTKLGQLSACFVLPVEDSMKGIFGTLKDMSIIHQSGGGTGFSFSRLRPEGDLVASTRSPASGPVSFMRVYDEATETIKQGGKRRGANMAVLRVDHPDILKFISAKRDGNELQNFNISVAVTDDFMRSVSSRKRYPLVNPRTGEAVGELGAADVFKQIVLNAWSNGDPGLLFIDEINRKNPLPSLGKIESTNPCGEQPLLPYESCNLGSVNLSCFVSGKKVDWKRLEYVVRLAVRFLDDVIDANKYPLPEVEKVTKANRKIGLGVMGFADLLVKLKIPYDSYRAVKLAEKLMRFVKKHALLASNELGKERGNFPNFSVSKLAVKYKHMRNASLTTIAPTGTISIIAGCSSGIEPLFGVCFVRNVMDGNELFEANPEFRSMMKARGIYSKSLMHQVARHGSLNHISAVPRDIKKIFVTALDVKPEWHVRIQAAFQKHTDSAVSKTINFPKSAKIKDVEKAYLLAYKLKCKGVTVYRYGSRERQVLSFGGKGTHDYASVEAEYAGGCPARECTF